MPCDSLCIILMSTIYMKGPNEIPPRSLWNKSQAARHSQHGLIALWILHAVKAFNHKSKWKRHYIYKYIYIYISATGISSVSPYCIELPVIIRSNQWIFLNVKHSSCHSLWCMYLVKRGKLICKSAICKWGNYSKCSKLDCQKGQNIVALLNSNSFFPLYSILTSFYIWRYTVCEENIRLFEGDMQNRFRYYCTKVIFGI